MHSHPRRGLSVLMTADTVGGVWTYALELSRCLSEHRVLVSLATMGAPPSEAQRREAQAVGGLSLLESTFRLEWMDDPWEDVARAGDWLLGLERALSPDVVHLNGYCHGALPWRAPTLMVGHSCVLSWWEAVKGEPAPARYDRYREEVRRGIGAASRLVAPTWAMLRALTQHYGEHPEGRVIPNGREPAGSGWGQRRRAESTGLKGAWLGSTRGEAHGLEAKEDLVVCATRVWDEAKNVGALAKAAQGLSWKVFVAGDAGDAGDAGSERRRGLEGVTLLGRLEREEVLRWLGRAAIFALPARYEPFGLSALEAAGAGCALVLGDIPSLREIWGNAAVFVPPDAPEQLREAIEALIQDPTRRQELGARAQSRSLRFGGGQMGRHYVTTYADLAESRVAALRESDGGQQGSWGQDIEQRDSRPCAS